MTDQDEILDDPFFEQKSLTDKLKGMQSKVNRSGNFLFAIGLITLIVTLFIEYAMLNTIEIFYYSMLGVFYIGMGFLSIEKPVLGLGIALFVYLSLFICMTNTNPLFFKSILTIKVFVSIILLIGIINAIKVEKLKKNGKQ